MYNLIKKNLVFLLALVLMLGVFPNSTFAEDSSQLDNEETYTSTDNESISNYGVGEVEEIDDIDENQEFNEETVPDAYGTSPETTFSFEVDGEAFEAGDAFEVHYIPSINQVYTTTTADSDSIYRPAAIGINTIRMQPTLFPSAGNSKITVGMGVQSVSGSKPVLVSINYVLKKAMTKGGSSEVISRTSDNITLPGVGSSTQKLVPLSGVGYYSVTFETSIHYPKEIVPRVVTSDKLLLSRTARTWPGDYVDSVSGKRVTDPVSLTWPHVVAAKRVKWGSPELNKFRTWYETTYRLNNFNWSGIDVHHIKPKEYGGTNDPSNLIPMPKPVHQLYTSFFAGYK